MIISYVRVAVSKSFLAKHLPRFQEGFSAKGREIGTSRFVIHSNVCESVACAM